MASHRPLEEEPPDKGYGARPINRRRASRAVIQRRRTSLCQIVACMRPITVRQVFYQASVRGLVDKTEAGYKQVQNDLVRLRRDKVLPYGWLTDSTRWQRKPLAYDSPQEAAEDTARHYRKRLWTSAGVYVEIWLEKDALAGVVLPLTDKYDVPLMVSRGYASFALPAQRGRGHQPDEASCLHLSPGRL